MSHRKRSHAQCLASDEEIAERWAALWNALPAALERANPVGVHDMRVASRRVRAAMDLGVGCHPRHWYQPLRKTARSITRALADIQDREVALAAFTAARADATPDLIPGVDRLVIRVARERDAAHVVMTGALDRLMTRKLARELERRFGPAATPGHAATKGGTSK